MIRLACFVSLALIGCITEPKTIQKDYEAPAACLSQPDSSTWTDTTQTDHFSCHINPSK